MALHALYGVGGDSPSPIIWQRPDITSALRWGTGKYFHEDWTSLAIPLAVASNAAVYQGNHGWYSYQDTGDVVTQLATNDNGVLNLAIAATDNNESWLQPGSAGSVMFTPKTPANGGKSIFFETRVNMSTLVGNMFVGLAEEASAAANFIADSGGAPADKDYIGFLVDEDAPTVARFTWRKSGGTAVDLIASAHTFVANTFVKLGFIIDMEDGDSSKRIKVFVDGVLQGTYGTNTQFIDTTNFPTGEEMHVIFGGKNNNAAKVVRQDWVRVYQDRYDS